MCSLCLFKNEHDKEHHIIDINKKESLEKNGISYDKSISEFNETFEKWKSWKGKLKKK